MCRRLLPVLVPPLLPLVLLWAVLVPPLLSLVELPVPLPRGPLLPPLVVVVAILA